MINSFFESLFYIMADQYFLLSMATTVMIGIFLGATLYDGLIAKLWKALISLSCYGFLMIATTTTRIIPVIEADTFRLHHPFSGVATVIAVSFFYFLGMTIGVFTTYFINKKRGKIKL